MNLLIISDTWLHMCIRYVGCRVMVHVSISQTVVISRVMALQYFLDTMHNLHGFIFVT